MHKEKEITKMLLYTTIHAVLIATIATPTKSFYSYPRWRSFPEDFRFGIGSSAYQIEGGWNASGKGESIWDNLLHKKLTDNENGDVTCDSYHQYERDIDLLKQLNVSFYRFSLSWSRLFSNGSINTRNKDGFRYYNALIDGLIHQGIKPVVTLFHWDHPQSLENIGGWTNPNIQDYFQDYANECFKAFGDRVKTWVTFNEPNIFCMFVYGLSPINTNENPDKSVHQCGHNVLLTHAKVYHLYNHRYKAKQQGEVGISLETDWYDPASSSPQDVIAAQRALEYELGWFAHPIHSADGDYPQMIKDHFPTFTSEEVKLIRGTSDFFGLNHYTSSMVMDNSNLSYTTLYEKEAMYRADPDVFTFRNDSWYNAGFGGFWVNPEGFNKLLIHIMNTYENPEIRIYENGCPTKDVLDDVDRIKFLKQYLNAMMDAMENGVRVSSYCFWTLMDDFEWLNGFKPKYGLFAVDFENPEKKITPKKSAAFFKDLVSRKVLQQVTSSDMFDRR